MNKLDVYKLRQYPKKLSGLYFLFKKDTLVYIGETTNFLARIGQHSTGRMDWDSYSFVPLELNPKSRRFLEWVLIYKYSPKYNNNLTAKPFPKHGEKSIQKALNNWHRLKLASVIQKLKVIQL